MLDQLAAAFERQDYKAAASLLKQLQQQSPDSPWVTFYLGRLREGTGKLEAAELIYRSLLQATANSKVAAQARLGIQRLAALKTALKTAQPTGAESGVNPGASVTTGAAQHSTDEPGLLVLKAIEPEYRQQSAQRFGQIMGLEAYSARMILPGRGWRLYRVGTVTDLAQVSQKLTQAEIPAFWQPLSAINTIRVFRVRYIETASPQVKIICENEAGQTGGLSLHWSEVSARVEGRLPIFEQVVDLNARNQLTRRETTQDYAQVIDLHLPQRSCMLRFGDWNYQFDQGVLLDASQDGQLSVTELSNRIRWNKLVYFLDQQLSTVPVWTEFSQFAETALDLLPLIELESKIDLLRKAPSYWDQAFQLYSGLIFRQSLK
ncbi:MAG: tetratricopeptide repeat protein [Pegethrix bostrychoides GSE-TBD4-15B]|jgi:tetratricopeptide (TPR) repeat protein|uniref:Tetratricopeptide repeat protein n=1 Tax=Pegethrix bostrychoides GSE-TBD4-15B TaxID=2839662 RepID=A0A951P7R2_9CYAN|nr:tetratricopeptide repeat protein [Pegethrix bostrychoides GSE-TBD4-15B]